jgi:hypothetical protein
MSLFFIIIFGVSGSGDNDSLNNAACYNTTQKNKQLTILSIHQVFLKRF